MYDLHAIQELGRWIALGLCILAFTLMVFVWTSNGHQYRMECLAQGGTMANSGCANPNQSN